MRAPLTSRRRTLGSALAAPLLLPLALAGCDIDPPRPQASPGATAPPPEDAALVGGVVADLVRAEALLAAVATATPDLADRLAPVSAAHAAHREVLAGAVPEQDLPTATTPGAPERIIPALRAVARSEQRLLRTVREACGSAASGDLARVLASVAASTSQHAASLSPAVTS